MSAPPGYNANHSLLQTQVESHGGTASIVPVMGGGRVRGALKQIRRKHTKRGLSKKKGKTKKNKRRLLQRGGINHYSLPTTDLTDNNEISTQVTTISLPATADKDILEKPIEDTIKQQKLTYYLNYQNKLWVRKLRETLFKNAGLKSIIPNLENIGCVINRSSGGIYTKRYLQMYSPDRLCCILPKETGSITVLPAVKGQISNLKIVLTAIKTSMVNNNVFIFSPPFFGENLEDNKEVFYAFLKYKADGLENNKYLFYILTDYSLMNIETAKSVSKNIYDNVHRDLILDSNGGDKRLVGESIKKALYQMLEPTYIIYPYAISFPVTTVSSVIKDVTYEENERMFLNAQKEYRNADADVRATQKALKKEETSLTKLRSTAFEKGQQYSTEVAKAEKEAADNFDRDPKYATARISYQQRMMQREKEVQSAVNSVVRTDFDGATKLVSDTEGKIVKLKAELAKKQPVLELKTRIYDEAKKVFIPKEKDETNISREIEEQRGGILFSAANKDEPILPAPYSGFDGPIQYIQTNDVNTARGSIAYRPDLAKKEPLLDTMNYKEYNLLLRPPMSSNSMYEFYLKNKPDQQTSTDSNPKMFMPNTKSSHMRVPGTAISVGLKEFVVRNPVPDVVADWESGIYSQDESDYLNAMKLTPEILRTVFKDNWKKEVSNHLSMISRSKCFKDTRLILHSECQDAQKFISAIMKYYTENSESILKLQREQDIDYMKRLQSALDSKLDEKYANIAESIFNHAEFVRAFYPPKMNAGAQKGQFLVSVSPIMVSRKGTKFQVSYDNDPLLTETQFNDKVKAIADTLKKGDITLTNNNKIWEFGDAVNMYQFTKRARLDIPSFVVTNLIESTEPDVLNEIYVSYFGELSEDDKKLIDTTTGNKIVKTEQVKNKEGTYDSGLYKFAFHKPVNLVNYQTNLDKIANNNIYYITCKKREDFSYEDVNYITPKDDSKGTTLITVLLREKAKPDTDIAADFGITSFSGLNSEKVALTLFQEFNRIANIVNSGSVFGGKYVFSRGNHS